jgi:hypothetical protein
MSKALATKNVAAVLLGVALVFGFAFAFAVPAKADTISDLQTQIQSLLAQIAALQGSSTTTTTSSTSCQTFTQNLTVGSSGGEVMSVQKFLNAHGAQVAASGAGSPGNETSYFGALTQAAVSAFQTANGITPTAGYWGPITRAKANSMCASSGSTTTTTTTGGTTTTTATGPGITVSAAAQPANSLAPQGASRVPFTTFTLTNNSSAAVTINGITVQRTGLANDAAFAGIVLVDQNGLQVGVSRTLDSNDQATIGDTITLNAGQTATYTVAGNMATSLAAYSGQVAGISVIGVNTTVPVAGSLPITGAQQTLNGNLTIGTVTAALSSFDPNNAETENIGDTGVRFAGVRLTAGSAENVKLFSIRWRLNGSVSPSDMANVVTMVNGTSYPTTLSADGRYYTSVFPGGILMDEGFSADVYVQGDLVGSNSAGRIAEFDIDKTSDIYLVGQTFGYGITISPTGSSALNTNSVHGTTINTANQPWFQASTISIQGGTVTAISNAPEVASQNIAISVPNEPLGGFATNFTGEPVSVQTMVFDVATSSSGCTNSCQLQNVSIVNSSGAVVAGPVNGVYNGTVQTLTFSNTVTFPVGRQVYTLKGTVPSGEANGETYVVSTTPDNSSMWSNVTGQQTGNTVSLAGIGTFNMNTMTVRGASLQVSLSSTPSSQTIVRGGQNVLMANVQLDASQSGEDVRINSIPLHVHQLSVATGGTVTNLSSCALYDSTGTQLNYGSNIVNSFTNDATGTITSATYTKSFSLNNSLTIPEGTVVTLPLECTVSSSATPGDAYNFAVSSGDSVTFTGATSGNSSTVAPTASVAGTQTIASVGSIAVSNNSLTPSYAVSAGGTTGVVMGVANFHPSNEAVNLTKVGLTLAGTNGSSHPQDLGTVYLYNSSNQLIGTATFTGSNTTATAPLTTQLNLPKDTDTPITIKADLAAIGSSAPGIEGDQVSVDVVNYEGSGVSSGSPVRGGAATYGLTSFAGIRVFKSFPTISQGTLASNGVAGDGQLIRFAVNANSTGSVGINQFVFTIASSTGVSLTNLALYAYSDSGYSTPASGTTGGVAVSPSYTTNGGIATTTISTPLQVPAGGSLYFLLKGTVSYSGANSTYNISATLKGDSTSIGVINGTLAQTDYSMVWSPNATSTAAISGTGSGDWTNGYGIVGLPSIGITQSRTN